MSAAGILAKLAELIAPSWPAESDFTCVVDKAFSWPVVRLPTCDVVKPVTCEEVSAAIWVEPSAATLVVLTALS